MVQLSNNASTRVRPLNAFGKSVPDEMKVAQNKGNEDFLYPPRPADMPNSSVFIVGDFMSTTFPDVGEQAVFSISRILKRAGRLPPRHLLCMLANDLDKAMKNAAQGRHAVEFTMAAGVISDGDYLYYLTIGDCGINVYRDGRLHLLNGSHWQVSSTTVESGDEISRGVQAAPWPPSRTVKCGRGTTFIQPRDVDVFWLQKGDMVLFFSDGIERNLTPVDRLKLIESPTVLAEGADLEALVQRTLSEAQQRGGGDDCTLLAVAGPFEHTPSEEVEQMKTGLDNSLRQLTTQIVDSRESVRRLEENAARHTQLEGIVAQLSQLHSTLSELSTDARTRLEQLAEDSKKATARREQIILLNQTRPTLEDLQSQLNALADRLERNVLGESDVESLISKHVGDLLTRVTDIGEKIKSYPELEITSAARQEESGIDHALSEVREKHSELMALLTNIKRYVEDRAAGVPTHTDVSQGAAETDLRGGIPDRKDPAEQTHVPVHLNDLEGHVAQRVVDLLINCVSELRTTVESHKSKVQSDLAAKIKPTNATAPVSPAQDDNVREVAVKKESADYKASTTVTGLLVSKESSPPDAPINSPDLARAANTNTVQSGKVRIAFQRILENRKWWLAITHAVAMIGALSVGIVIGSRYHKRSTETPLDSPAAAQPNSNAKGEGNSNNSGTSDSGQATAAGGYRIAVRPDGWTIVIAGPDKEIKPRVPYYRNPERFNEDGRVFKSEKEAAERLTQLFQTEKALYSKPDEILENRSGLEIYKVTKDDINKATKEGSNVCEAVVQRRELQVNELRELNKQLDCDRQLAAGDVLVVKAITPQVATTTRLPGRSSPATTVNRRHATSPSPAPAQPGVTSSGGANTTTPPTVAQPKPTATPPPS